MSTNLDIAAARLREGFGPEDARFMVEQFGLAVCIQAAVDQRMAFARAEGYTLSVTPRWRFGRRRKIRRTFRMMTTEMERRCQLCVSVAKAWGKA